MTYTNKHGRTTADVAYLRAGQTAELVFEKHGRRQRVTGELIDYGGDGGLYTPLYDVVRSIHGSPGALLVEVVSPKPPTRPDGLYEVVSKRDGSRHYIRCENGAWVTPSGDAYTTAWRVALDEGYTVGARYVLADEGVKVPDHAETGEDEEPDEADRIRQAIFDAVAAAKLGIIT